MRRIQVDGQVVEIRGTVVRQAKLEADKYHFLDDPGEMLAALQKVAVRVDLFSFLARLSDPPDSLLPYHKEQDNLAVIQVSSFEDWWNNQIRFEARNRAKQAAKKGLMIREVPFDENLARGIWKIYNESRIRQGRPFPHFGKSFATVYREAATYLPWSTFVGAFQGDELVGFAKLVADQRRTQANLMNILSMLAHRDKSPTNAILAQAVRSCADHGYRYLVYQNFAYGRKAPDSLSKFKEANGFKKIEVPRYFAPLTPLGKVALQLGLHRRLADRIPSGLAGRLRDLRNSIYSRTARSSSTPARKI